MTMKVEIGTNLTEMNMERIARISSEFRMIRGFMMSGNRRLFLSLRRVMLTIKMNQDR